MVIPFNSGRGCRSASLPEWYLEEPWDFLGFFLGDLLNGSILSTRGPADILNYLSGYTSNHFIWKKKKKNCRLRGGPSVGPKVCTSRHIPSLSFDYHKLSYSNSFVVAIECSPAKENKDKFIFNKRKWSVLVVNSVKKTECWFQNWTMSHKSLLATWLTWKILNQTVERRNKSIW